MSEPTKCPKCGAKQSTIQILVDSEIAEFKCGTRLLERGEIVESFKCLRNQVAQLTAQLAAKDKRVAELECASNSLAGYATTCLKTNTTEWLVGLCKRINAVCAAMNDPDRFEVITAGAMAYIAYAKETTPEDGAAAE